MLSAIERIEVIRGPMSTLYGSDAMGGVINIITRKVGKEWSGSLTQDYTYQENRDFGDTRNTSIYASGPLIDDLLGLQVRVGSLFNREESDLSYGNGVDVSKRGPSPVDGRTNNLGARLTLKLRTRITTSAWILNAAARSTTTTNANSAPSTV